MSTQEDGWFIAIKGNNQMIPEPLNGDLEADLGDVSWLVPGMVI